MRPRFTALLLTALLPACAPAAATSPSPAVPAAEGAPRAPLAWAELSPATFARAKAERRFVILDGSAEWCHWCHVMEAVTYHDPEVRKLLDERFIAVKVDVDARPDVEERYEAWGWPATVIFSPDAEELGKLRGYVPPEELARVLRDVVASGAVKADDAPPADAPPRRLSDETLAWISGAVETELDEYWDEARGGWGKRQKAAIAEDDAWALARARAGDAKARERALRALAGEARLFDPVWGGIYQYSAASDWDHPHYEKLMPYQAGAIESFAVAYEVTGDPALLAGAESVRRYVDAFLVGEGGAFDASQDADLNAHDAARPFLSGHAYYAKGDAERRALGIPRVDAHAYADDNGRAIAAYATLYEAAREPEVLEAAERAAARILATHRTKTGGLAHAAVAADADPIVHLSDEATFAWGLARLHDATGERRYLDDAAALAEAIVRDLRDPETGALFAATANPDEVGVFARRFVDWDSEVMAARLFAKLAEKLPDRRAAYLDVARAAVGAVATPARIKARGRMVGGLLLAIAEVTARQN